LLSIGTELDQLAGSAYLAYWTDIISSVRAVFSGQLTYSAIWDDAISPWQGHNGLAAGTGNLATQVSFWSQLDYVGLDAYPAISEAAQPTLDDLIAGWIQVPTDPETKSVTGNQPLISYFEGVAAQIGKPLLFTEIGYESATDAARKPAGSSTNIFDPQLQADLYTAFSRRGNRPAMTSSKASISGTGTPTQLKSARATVRISARRACRPRTSSRQISQPLTSSRAGTLAGT